MTSPEQDPVLALVPANWTLMSVEYRSWRPKSKRYFAVLMRRRKAGMPVARGEGTAPLAAVADAAKRIQEGK